MQRLEFFTDAPKTEETVVVPDDFHGDPDMYVEDAIESSLLKLHDTVSYRIYLALRGVNAGKTHGRMSIEEGKRPFHSWNELFSDSRISFKIVSYLSCEELCSKAWTCIAIKDILESNAYWASVTYRLLGQSIYEQFVARHNAGGWSIRESAIWTLRSAKAMQTRKYNLNKRNISGKDMIDAVVAHSRVDFAEAKMLTELKDRILLADRLEFGQLTSAYFDMVQAKQQQRQQQQHLQRKEKEGETAGGVAVAAAEVTTSSTRRRRREWKDEATTADREVMMVMSDTQQTHKENG